MSSSSRPGAGFKVWDASVVLMDWLHTNVGEIEQKNVVELGVGPLAYCRGESNKC